MRAGGVALALWALIGASASAQVTPHPREMGLPEAPSPRPDPEDHAVTLANGVTAYIAEDRTVPLVTVTAFVNAGYADEPDGAAEALAAAYRRAGPAGMGAAAFHEAITAMVADYRVVLDAELLELTLDVPAEDGADALALLARLVVDGPEVTEADLSAARSQADAASSEGSGGPSYDGSLEAATALLRQHLLRDVAYAPRPRMDAASRLTLADVQDFHRDRFVGGNVTLAVGGAMDAARTEERLGAFERVPDGARHRRPTVEAPPPPDGLVLHTYPADKLQGWLVLGAALPVVPLEEEAALDVMNYIIGGGHFDTRLFREARDKRGLTNDASGFLEPATHGPGTYTFRTYGRPEAVRLLLDLTLAEIEKMRSGPVSEEELFVARGALADGVFAVRYRDGWSTARSFAEEHARHGDVSRSATYQERVRAVSDDDVLRAATKYLQPDGMTGVLIGPIDQIRAAPPMEGERALEDYARVVEGR